MRICPNKWVCAGIVMSLICLVLVDAVFLIDSKGNALLFVTVFSVLYLAFVLRYALAVAKTVVLDPSGCTFSFLCYRKHYLWSEFSVKKVEDYEDVYSYRQRPEAGAIFLIKPHRRPKWMGPGEFCMLKAPLSSFYVCFSIGLERFPNPYVVDKKLFLDTLSQWGVELDEG